MLRSVVPWFVVLPDTDDGLPVARSLRQACDGIEELRHPSGRPWLLGRWDSCQLTLGRSSDCVIAVIGEHSTTSEALTRHASRVTAIGDLDGLHPLIPGSAHLVASVAGKVRVQGTASGLRRVYRCAVGRVTVAGDRANVLAELSQASIDPARIAVRLLFSSAPWPLVWESVWSGVHAVLPGHCLLLDSNGTSRETRWWSPPPPELSDVQAASGLRTALTDAMAARVTPGQTVVSDLSGLDSSSICSLAVRAGAKVVALTGAQPDVMDDDVHWARQTVAGLHDAGYDLRHDVIPAADSPLVYDGILSARDTFDEPFSYVHNRRRFVYMLNRGAEHAPRFHFTGLGGDEICLTAYPWLYTLLRRQPLVGLRHARATVGRNKWSYGELARRVLGDRAYPSWLRSVATGLGGPSADRRGSGAGWGARPVLPAWATPDAVAMARRALLDAAAEPRLLADDPGMHFLLAATHTGAQEKRCFQQLGDQEGVRLSMPFFDDRVLNAALAVRPADRNDPGRYKPVLVNAMRGIVPPAVLGRVTKSDTATTAVMGSREHRDQIAGLAEDSQLAKLGLVDLARFREVCHGPIDIQTPNRRIEPTIGCEMWLRNRSEDMNVHIGG